MTPCPHTIGSEQSAKTALELMRKNNIRHLPVRDGGLLQGILSERDINYALAKEKKNPADLTVADIFYPNPLCVGPEENLADVASQMAENAYGSVLITEADKLLGIFTTVDACRVLSQVLKELN